MYGLIHSFLLTVNYRSPILWRH